TFADSSNNMTSCSFTVSVADNTPPVISGCPANITVQTGPGRTTCNQTASWTPPTATDNCGAVSTGASPLPGAAFLVGTTTVTYTFTDASNNTSTCAFNVPVADNTPPVISGCPANITVAGGSQAVTWTPPTASDNCGTPVR